MSKIIGQDLSTTFGVEEFKIASSTEQDVVVQSNFFTKRL